MIGRQMTEGEQAMGAALDEVIDATQELVHVSVDAGYDAIMPGRDCSWVTYYSELLEHLKADKRTLYTVEAYKEEQ